MVAAHTNPIRAPVEPVREFLSSLTTYVRKFAQGLQEIRPVGVEINDTPIATGEDASTAEHSANADYIVERFGYPREDVKQWLATVGYPDEVGLVDLKVIVQTLDILDQAGVVHRPQEGFEPEQFANGEIARFE